MVTTDFDKTFVVKPREAPAFKGAQIPEEALKAHRDAFCTSFLDELLPRWKEQPPDYFVRWRSRDDEDRLRRELETRANEVFDEMLDFAK